MKDLFFRIGVGCCVVYIVHLLAGFFALFYGRPLSEYTLGFFSCLFWWIAIDLLRDVK
ncbi:MAG: hypothetical protein J6S85_03115 [Methanobrevibacter sp.]|nr:hypothetical protein [Methanobrevibacter sp.]